MLDVNKIGRRIAEERKLVRRMSQDQMVEALYDKCGLSWTQPDISNLERAGSAIWNLKKLDQLADFFEIPLQHLLFGAEGHSRMPRYDGLNLTISKVSGETKQTKAIAKFFKQTFGTFAEKNVSRVECGPYSVYILSELHQIEALGKVAPSAYKKMNLPKLKLYVFLKGRSWERCGVPCQIFLCLCTLDF